MGYPMAVLATVPNSPGFRMNTHSLQSRIYLRPTRGAAVVRFYGDGVGREMPLTIALLCPG